MKPLLIESSSDMDALLVQLENETIIAVDTEFQRETSYYPHIALIQIASDSIVACIDPLAFDAKAALQKILLNKNITKIFHSCSQDMEVLFYYLGKIPAPVYDTQIANALLSEHHQVSYAALVESELGVQLDKSQTRTNWLQRPLTDKQIQYAGDDVFYLYQLYTLLDEKLRRAGREAWFEEESSALPCNDNNFQVVVDTLWKRVKGATRLNKKTLALVQAIAEWREQLAQQNDRTRRKILPDDYVIQLAIEQPDNNSALNSLIGHRYRFNDEQQQQLLDAIKKGQQCPENEWPDNRYNVLDNQQKALLKSLQQKVNHQAEALGISSAMLSSKKELEKLMLNPEPSSAQPEGAKTDITQAELKVLQGWRFHYIGQQLLETVKNAK